MDSTIIQAIRQGGINEIITLFRVRCEALQHSADLEILARFDPAIESIVRSQREVIRTIDDYMTNKLEPICRIQGEIIYGFAGQCQTIDRIGFAPGDLDMTDEGRKFINPALPGFTCWGVFENPNDDFLFTPPLSLQHLNTDDPALIKQMCLTSNLESE